MFCCTFLFITSSCLALNLERTGRIIDGDDAARSEIPYIVSLRWNKRHVCGASILNKNYVLTAAHCVQKEQSDYSIQYGTEKIHQDDTNSIEIKKIASHDDFQGKYNNFENDIAVLELQSSLPLSKPGMSPIRLPEEDEETPEDAEATLSGWGWIDDDPITRPQILQTITLQIYSDEDCEDAYETFRMTADHQYQICAGDPEGDQGICFGDSGGPLVVNGVQVGIVSWSAVNPCAQEGYPGVFTKVSRFVGWIRRIIKS